ncbi:TlpA family protein disulfide reductase [Rhodocyclus tenuis]|uniref:Thiol-disulfide isomerase/thioredoxin n=1 Tax=Rhodocyclus tenuis TaxID=1066 RepID=A0A840G6D5_RHOTE|nr:TlpA disulfide reductase family protein [Rhodocyclus tenuis]MBB4246288.1 thiol-disulfide isomerase/thioredoxin [Rhodocyclus tenuis]
MNRIVVFIAAFAIALAALVAGLYTSSRQDGSPSGSTATIPPKAAETLFAARLTNLQGGGQQLEQYRGKTLVVNFWAAWCPPCREEMPGFARLQRKFADKGVQFVGIALDNADNVRTFLQSTPVDYPQLLAGDDGSDLARAVGNSSLALPYTLIIDAGGKVRSTRMGYLPESDLEPLLQQALAN